MTVEELSYSDPRAFDLFISDLYRDLSRSATSICVSCAFCTVVANVSQLGPEGNIHTESQIESFFDARMWENRHPCSHKAATEIHDASLPSTNPLYDLYHQITALKTQFVILLYQLE
jgi:hypothetical protein